jgi:hypothetical protein
MDGGGWIALSLGLLVGGLILVVCLAASLREREPFTRQIGFRCPFSSRDVLCTLVQDTRTGRWVEVRSCSAFPDPGSVLCLAPCLRVLNAGVSVAGERRKTAGRRSVARPLH